jgi:RimJ/RimL family protein N-acetyltransferase
MSNVGFPTGLRITVEEVRQLLAEQQKTPVYGRNLVAELSSADTSIGECKMYQPDADGISRTDVKLLPEHWGNLYGVEIKRGLLDYLFLNTECQAVEGTPNVENIASIKMQESVGGIRVDETVHRFPEEMADWTRPVHHYVYLVYREVWEERRKMG